MVVRWLLVPLSMIVLLTAGCGTSGNEEQATMTGASTQPVSGYWTGDLHQAGLQPFKIAVSINADGGGAVAYTGIECAGTWAETGSNPPDSYEFREEIKFGSGGNCKGSGTVNLRRAGAQLDYAFEGGGVTSEGILSRATSQEMTRIFRQVGALPLPD